MTSAAVPEPAEQVRRAARALLTDPDGRVLLVRIRGEVPVDVADPVTDYWSLVGGEVEAGESFEDAVRREIAEETGHRVAVTGSCVWWRRKTVVRPDGVRLHADERYYWCPLPDATLDHDGLTEHERRLDLAFRWWDLDDPGLLRVRVFPEELVPATRALLRDGRPPEPVEIR